MTLDGSIAVQDAVALIKMRGVERTLVAVDGMSAAGKSTLATAVSESLNDATIIRGDDFYRVMKQDARFLLPPRRGYDEDYDWQRLRDEVLVPVREGRTARYRRYDWATGDLGELVEVDPTTVVIVEGVYVSRPELRAFYDLVIWVETDAATRAVRQAHRDDSPSWVDRWDRAERYFVQTQNPADTADMVLTGDGTI